MNRRILLLLLPALLGASRLLRAQQPREGYDYIQRFTAAHESTGVANDAVTIQQPTTGAKQVFLEGVYVYCSVACRVKFERNGLTAATATAFTPAPKNKHGDAATAKAFYASNVSTNGTTMGPPNGYHQPALSDRNYGDLNGIRLAGNDPTDNVTVRVSADAGTGDFQIVPSWRELP